MRKESNEKVYSTSKSTKMMVFVRGARRALRKKDPDIRTLLQPATGERIYIERIDKFLSPGGVGSLAILVREVMNRHGVGE